MRKIILLLVTFISFNCYSQSSTKDSIFLSISPIIDKENILNKEVIEALKNFLATKNKTTQEINKYWLPSEYKTNIFPYYDIYNIEASKYGKDFYKPSLMEIIPTENDNQKIVKIAYVGHDNETNQTFVKVIYNIVATKSDSGVVFSMYLNFSTKNWKETTIGSVTYKISSLSCRTLNIDEAIKQKRK